VKKGEVSFLSVLLFSSSKEPSKNEDSCQCKGRDEKEAAIERDAVKKRTF
jgi:hypothetical protein